MLACERGLTYAGIAVDVARRFALHVRGRGAKFTRANPPLAILGAQPFASRAQALRAEHALKCLSREEKLRWAEVWRYERSTRSGSEQSLTI